MTLSVKLEHQGKTYTAEIATAERVDLGPEDHGVISWNISFGGPSWGQGTGHRALGTGGYFPKILPLILKVFGTGNWSDIKGKRAYVLRDGTYGNLVGIANLDGDRVLIFDEAAS